MDVLTGGCMCGAVRFEVTGEMEFACLCHCPSCRKAAGAPLIGWAMFSSDALTCDRASVSQYASSDGARRSFCSQCGTTLFFEADYMPGLIDITIEAFDAPDRVQPSAEIWTQYETACVQSRPHLHRFDALPPQPEPQPE